MTKHIHIKDFTPKNRLSSYNIDIFQCAFDEICISLSNNAYFDASFIQFDIPVKEKAGFSWKCNKSSISCDSGRAADIIALFERFPEYAKVSVQKLVFDHEKKRCTCGL